MKFLFHFHRTIFVASLALLVIQFEAQADIPTNVKPVSVGLGGFNYYTAGPFANTMLTGGAWLEFGTDWGTEVYFYNTDGSLNPQFNEKGLPKYLNSGKRLRVLLWPYGVTPANGPARGNTGVGKWVVTWQGDADIRLNGATLIANESSGAATGRLVNGRRVYNMGASNPSGNLTIEALNADNPITDLKVWLPDPSNPQNASLENSNSMWHPTFLSNLSALDFNHLRFMDWGETNASPQRDWIDRRPPSFAMQHGKLNRRSPAEGIVNFTNSSGQPVYFDGTRSTGIAFEYMVALSNATNKDMWLCVPHLATDDFITNLANLVAFGSDGNNPYTSTQANPIYPPLNSNLKVYLEYSNEIWSSGNSFAQGKWAEVQGQNLGISKAQYNARRFAQVWSIFQTRFGGSARIVRSAAIFTGSSSYTTPFLTELASYGPTLNPPVTADIVAPTTYFGNGIQDWAYERANQVRGTPDQWFHTSDDFVHNGSTGATRPVSVPLGDPYWTSSQLTRQHAATFVEWKRRIFSGSTAAGGGPDSTGVGGGFKDTLAPEIASIFGQALPIIAYEGGPSLYSDYLDGGDSRDDGITNFMNALNRRSAFAEIYRIQLNMARSKGLDSHSMFVDVSSWGKYGQWGHLEFMDQPPSQSAKWQAVSAWADDIATVRPVRDLLGSRPSFTTSAALPAGRYGEPYSQDIAVTGGDGQPLITVIGSQLVSGLTLAPVAGDPTRLRLSGTPEQGGWSYFYLRVQDGDGDASWRIFNLYVIGGPGNLLEMNVAGTFSGASSLPWTATHVIDPAITWSGLDRGAPNASGGGSAIGTDGTGVTLFSGNDGIRFTVSQGQASASASTLTSAITDNEYFKFTVTPKPGEPLNLRKASLVFTWVRESDHASRNFVVMTSIDGFTAGQQVYTLPTTPSVNAVSENAFTLPDTPAYSNITAPIEFRLYFYGGQYAGHKSCILGLQVTRNIPTPPTVLLDESSFSCLETQSAINVTAQRIGTASGVVTVSYSTSNGTATAGSDYTTTSGTLTWADGEFADKVISIPILNDSIYHEGDESFTLNLHSPTGGLSLGTPSSATITITDNDTNAPPVITRNAPSNSPASLVYTDSLTLDFSVTDDGFIQPVILNWSKFTGPGDATFVDSTSGATTVSFSEIGSYVLRLTAADGENTSTSDLMVDVTPPPPFASWLASNHPTLTGLNALPTSDPDDDGWASLFEYAMGTNPNSGTSIPSLVPSLSPTPSLTFTPKIVFGLSYVVEASSDLVNWTDSPITNLIFSQPYTYVHATPLTGATPKRFLRLKISESP